MTAPPWVIVLVAVCLAVVSAATSAGDRTLLVSPPESVTEDFVRRLETGRYDRAREHLREEVRRNITSDSLKRFTEALRSGLGEIEEIRGERRAVGEERAVASSELKTRKQGEISLEWGLVWESGQWVLDGSCRSSAVECALVARE